MIDVEVIESSDELFDLIEKVEETNTEAIIEMMVDQYAHMCDDDVIKFHETIEHCITLAVKRRIEVQNADG